MQICDWCRRACADEAAVQCAVCGHATRAARLDEAEHLGMLDVVLEGKYRIVGLLGYGGMGVVYLVEHLLLAKPMAAKVLHEEAAAQKSMVQRFLAEAEALARLDHPNIVNITDRGTLIDGRPFIVMELLSGESLADLLDRRYRLSETLIAHIALGVGRGLHAAHERGVIHRDLKPENVFLVRTAADEPVTIKLLDFGIARLAADRHRPGSAGITGQVIGTAPYMAPEQLEAPETIDPRVDIYALGVLLYEMATGELPFRGTTQIEALMARLHQTPPPPRTLVPELSLMLEEIILRCLERDRERRFASVPPLLGALGAIGGKAGEQADLLPPPLRSDVRLSSPTPLPAPSAWETRRQPVDERPPSETLERTRGESHRAAPPAPAARPPRQWLIRGLGAGIVVMALLLSALWWQQGHRSGAQRLLGPHKCPAMNEVRYGGAQNLARLLEDPRLSLGAPVKIVESTTHTDRPTRLLETCTINVGGYLGALPPAVQRRFDAHLVAYDAIALVTHPKAPLRDLSHAELQGMLRGRRPDMTMVVPGREVFMRPFIEALRGERFASSETGFDIDERIRIVEQTPTAWSIFSYASVVQRLQTLRPLTIAGQGPTDPDYPRALIRPVYVLVRKGTLEPAVQRMLDFLGSEKGQRSIERFGYRRMTPRRVIYGGAQATGRLLKLLERNELIGKSSLAFNDPADRRNAVTLLASHSADLAGVAGEEATPPGDFLQQVVGYDPVHVIVHPGVTRGRASLMHGELQGLLNGQIRNWRQLGGPDLPVVVVVPGTSSPMHAYLKQEVGVADYAADVRLVEPDELLEQVMATEGAIGFAGELDVPENESGLHLLTIDGYPPDHARYPLLCPLVVWYRKEMQAELQPLLAQLMSPNLQCFLETIGIRASEPVHCTAPAKAH